MKKENYAYLISGISFLIIWVIDMLSFFKMTQIWEMVRGIYGLGGWFLGLALILESIPTTKSNGTKRNCDMCGDIITRDEDSTHFLKEDSDTRDYCEECSKKIIK